MADSPTDGSAWEPVKYLAILFLALFFLWYISGGPERWDAKFEKIKKGEEKAPLFIKSPDILKPLKD